MARVDPPQVIPTAPGDLVIGGSFNRPQVLHKGNPDDVLAVDPTTGLLEYVQRQKPTTVGPVAPSSPVVGDIWVDTTDTSNEVPPVTPGDGEFILGGPGGVTTPDFDASVAAAPGVLAVTPSDGQVIIGASPSPIKVNGPYNLKAKGAVADGVTSDVSAINSAMTSAGPAGRRIDVPSGTYGIGGAITFKTGTLHFRGDGSPSTIIKPTTSMSMLLNTHTQFVDHVIFEDMTFDGVLTSTLNFLNLGYGVGRLTCRRCRFINMPLSGNAALLADIERVKFESCDFSTQMNTAGTGLGISGGIADLDIFDSDFQWLNAGILLNGDINVDNRNLIERVRVIRNSFDGYWYLGKAHFSGSGASVTYSTTGMTDTAANFSGIDTGFQTIVRAMPVRQVVSGTAFNSMTMTASDGAFISNGVVPGEIIRTNDGLKWAIISAIVSETELDVESWMDTTTGARVDSPSTGSSVTIWGIIQATISTFTSTTLTNALSWSSLDGHYTLPPNGTRYEVMYKRHNYHFNSTASVRDLLIQSNIFRRGYSDQISVFGARAQILDNDIMDGEDMGITHNGGVGGAYGMSIIAHNRIRRQGTAGIYQTAPNTIVEANNIKGFAYVNRNDGAGAGILFGGGTANRSRYVNNLIDGEGRSEAFYGIIAGQADGAAVLDNGITGVSQAEVWVRPQPGPAYATNLHLRGNYPRIKHRDAANTFDNPGMFYELRGNGSPEAVMIAGPGSTWLDVTNGKLYVKQTGTGNTGWQVQA